MNIENLHWRDIDEIDFLHNYWQRQPLLLRQALPYFSDLISADELAGLASEAAVESRLIVKHQQQWQAESGPFEAYDHLGETDWSLVLQAVDHWVPNVAKLTQAFHFLPDWRRDDVMVSFAATGGSVGPHIDNYDTFICQGSGRRHWRVGDQGTHQQHSPHHMLLHVGPFEAILDTVLECGDILYIPPGYPHEGIALEPSMSFSVGFRTQSAQAMLSHFADHLIDKELATHLLQDPMRPACKHSGEINADDIQRIRQHMLTAIQDDHILADFCGHHFSSAKHELDLPATDIIYDQQQIIELLQTRPLHRLEGLRCHYVPHTLKDGFIYVNGEAHQLDAQSIPGIKMLADHQQLEGKDLKPCLTHPPFLTFLVSFINQGCWYFPV